MIVWGGDDGAPCNDGSRYDPKTDTWTRVAPTSLAGRSWHTQLWTGKGMLVWGGSSGPRYRDGAIYFP
jgi:hypothetical protein